MDREIWKANATAHMVTKSWTLLSQLHFQCLLFFFFFLWSRSPEGQAQTGFVPFKSVFSSPWREPFASWGRVAESAKAVKPVKASDSSQSQAERQCIASATSGANSLCPSQLIIPSASTTSAHGTIALRGRRPVWALNMYWGWVSCVGVAAMRDPSCFRGVLLEKVLIMAAATHPGSASGLGCLWVP